LFLADEMLGPILVSLHNIAYYHNWMKRIRDAIDAGRLSQMLQEFEARSRAELSVSPSEDQY
jgi:queuine tRNA-ribosyltransferase